MSATGAAALAPAGDNPGDDHDDGPAPAGGLVTSTALGWVVLAWTAERICRSSLFLATGAAAYDELRLWHATETTPSAIAEDAARKVVLLNGIVLGRLGVE